MIDIFSPIYWIGFALFVLYGAVRIIRELYNSIKEKAVGHCLYMTILLIMTILIAIWHYNRIDFFF